jgi:hypothetical protein
MTDIVERMREIAGLAGDNECLALEAADEIERLKARIADLEDRLLETGQWHAGVAKKNELRMDNIRLRAALQTIAGTSKFKPPPVEEMVDIAKVALAGHGEHKT